jgi:hypothetical protein
MELAQVRDEVRIAVVWVMIVEVGAEAGLGQWA